MVGVSRGNEDGGSSQTFRPPSRSASRGSSLLRGGSGASSLGSSDIDDLGSIDPQLAQVLPPAAHVYNKMTFGLVYAFDENFVLPLSHDEVVHGKRSLLGRMPGDEWQRFANLRLLYGFMFAHPGTKLLFMGGEFGQGEEWNFQQSLDWHLLQYDFHKGIQKLVTDLNMLYRTYPALYEKQFSPEGFQWIDYGDAENSVLTYIRKGKMPKDDLIIACNFTPVPRENYRIGVPKSRKLEEVFNSDAPAYGGSGIANGPAKVSKTPWHGFEHSIEVSLPPLSVVVFR